MSYIGSDKEEEKKNAVKDKDPLWDVSSAGIGIGLHQEILPVARKSRPEGHYRGSDHGSTRTSSK